MGKKFCESTLFVCPFLSFRPKNFGFASSDNVTLLSDLKRSFIGLVSGDHLSGNFTWPRQTSSISFEGACCLGCNTKLCALHLIRRRHLKMDYYYILGIDKWLNKKTNNLICKPWQEDWQFAQHCVRLAFKQEFLISAVYLPFNLVQQVKLNWLKNFQCCIMTSSFLFLHKSSWQDFWYVISCLILKEKKQRRKFWWKKM